MALVGYIIVIANLLIAAQCAYLGMWPLPILNLFCAGLVLRSLWSKR